MVLLEFLDQVLEPMAGSHRKRPKVIRKSTLPRRHKIGQTQTGPTIRFENLLSKKVKSRQHRAARFVRVQGHVVAHTICRKQSVRSTRLEQLPFDNFREQLL